MPKFHLRHPADASLPFCGRQLNNHRDTRSQLHDSVAFAADTSEFVLALNGLGQFKRPSACRHCARVAGMLPPLKRPARHQPPATGGGEPIDFSEEYTGDEGDE